ncbi:MAG: MFS transporter [Candidatus Thorarchaeota archaeon]|nr:MAG: MFS transporter [Candidatus Thorarchaeota archaeon]
MTRLARFLGLEDAPSNALRLARIMAILMPSYAMAFSISTTFWLIFIAEKLGNGSYMAGLSTVGLLVVIQLVIQVVLDYPTGSLGDHIGQKFVIASALVCYALMFWLSSTVTEDSSLYTFAAIYALLGAANSQESGAWGSWFDSNYRAAHPNDEDRKQYGVFQGKLGMLFGLSNTIVLIPGGWLAYSLGREWVFQGQAVICVLLALVVLRYLNDLPEVEQKRKEDKDKSDYTQLLKDGVSFLGSDRFITFMIAGQVLLFSITTVYINLVLFPFYFVYLLTDIAVASYRTFLYVPQVPLQERSGIWSRRFDPAKWIPRFELLSVGATIPLVVMAALLVVAPPPATADNLVRLMFPGSEFVILEAPLESIPVLIVIAVLFVFGFLMGTFAGILSQRVLIDVIPNRIRNSVYSLRPTLIMIAAMPIMAVSGEMITTYGLPPALVLLASISFAGTLLVWKAFQYPIPKASDLEDILIPEKTEDVVEEKRMEMGTSEHV